MAEHRALARARRAGGEEHDRDLLGVGDPVDVPVRCASARLPRRDSASKDESPTTTTSQPLRRRRPGDRLGALVGDDQAGARPGQRRRPPRAGCTPCSAAATRGRRAGSRSTTRRTRCGCRAGGPPGRPRLQAVAQEAGRHGRPRGRAAPRWSRSPVGASTNATSSPRAAAVARSRSARLVGVPCSVTPRSWHTILGRLPDMSGTNSSDILRASQVAGEASAAAAEVAPTTHRRARPHRGGVLRRRQHRHARGEHLPPRPRAGQAQVLHHARRRRLRDEAGEVRRQRVRGPRGHGRRHRGRRSRSSRASASTRSSRSARRSSTSS